MKSERKEFEVRNGQTWGGNRKSDSPHTFKEWEEEGQEETETWIKDKILGWR